MATVKQMFTASVQKEDEWYVAQALEVDVASQGETIDSALANLREGARAVLDAARRHEPPPNSPGRGRGCQRLGLFRTARVARKLMAAGFAEIGQQGSHVKFDRATGGGRRVTIVPPSGDSARVSCAPSSAGWLDPRGIRAAVSTSLLAARAGCSLPMQLSARAPRSPRPYRPLGSRTPPQWKAISTRCSRTGLHKAPLPMPKRCSRRPQ